MWFCFVISKCCIQYAAAADTVKKSRSAEAGTPAHPTLGRLPAHCQACPCVRPGPQLPGGPSCHPARKSGTPALHTNCHGRPASQNDSTSICSANGKKKKLNWGVLLHLFLPPNLIHFFVYLGFTTRHYRTSTRKHVIDIQQIISPGKPSLWAGGGQPQEEAPPPSPLCPAPCWGPHFLPGV